MQATQGESSFQLEEALRVGKSKRQVMEIAAWVGRNRRRFSAVAGIMMGTDSKLSARAAWVVSTCVDAHPDLLEPHLNDLVRNLDRHGLHPAIARNTFRMLRFAPIPGDLEGRVLSAALAALGGPVPVAVKANAMTVLKRLAADFPEILTEVKLLIAEQAPDASAGFHARARREFGMGVSRGRKG